MSDFDKVLEDIKQREVQLGIEIATLQADRDNIRAELKDCVNELCLKCGSYKEEHNGACNGCRWLEPRRGW